MNLRKTRISEVRPAAMRAPHRRGIATLGVGGKIKYVSVPARCKYHHVGCVSFNRAGQKIARNHAASFAVDDHEIEHLAARVHLDAARSDLLFERLIRAQEQLLPCLPARIKGARNLHAAERACIEQSAVFARERHTLCDALVDDVHADLRETIYVSLARPKISAFHRVVEKAVNAVAVISVIFRGIDAALRGDGMRAARTVLEAKAMHVVSLLG